MVFTSELRVVVALPWAGAGALAQFPAGRRLWSVCPWKRPPPLAVVLVVPRAPRSMTACLTDCVAVLVLLRSVVAHWGVWCAQPAPRICVRHMQ